MTIVVRKSVAVTKKEVTKSRFAEPKIWRGKNRKGVYVRVDEETRLWFSKATVEAMANCQEGVEADEGDSDED